MLSCMDGTVRAVVKRNTDYGNHIIVDHADGFTTWYAHLDDILCAVGDVVKRGKVIGTVGSTGNSTGPHLHLTVQNIFYGKHGYWLPNIVNPLHYL